MVRRYAHLSPSHLQAEVEKVAAFGKELKVEEPKAKADGKDVEQTPGLRSNRHRTSRVQTSRFPVQP